MLSVCPSFLPVCSPLISYKLIDRLSRNSACKSCHSRWPRRHFLPRSLKQSKITGVQTSEMYVNVAPDNVGPRKCVLWFVLKGGTTFKMTIFLKRTNIRTWREELVITRTFYGDISWTATLRLMNFGAVQDHGHTYEFCLNCYFVWRNF
jgi:hypothetical protein